MALDDYLPSGWRNLNFIPKTSDSEQQKAKGSLIDQETCDPLYVNTQIFTRIYGYNYIAMANESKNFVEIDNIYDITRMHLIIDPLRAQPSPVSSKRLIDAITKCKNLKHFILEFNIRVDRLSANGPDLQKRMKEVLETEISRSPETWTIRGLETFELRVMMRWKSVEGYFAIPLWSWRGSRSRTRWQSMEGKAPCHGHINAGFGYNSECRNLERALADIMMQPREEDLLDLIEQNFARLSSLIKSIKGKEGAARSVF